MNHIAFIAPNVKTAEDWRDHIARLGFTAGRKACTVTVETSQTPAYVEALFKQQGIEISAHYALQKELLKP